jgi:hypothetical protein
MNPDEILRLMYGYASKFPHFDRTPTPRGFSKHNASKRGYQHKHRLSRGQRNHLRFVGGGS